MGSGETFCTYLHYTIFSYFPLIFYSYSETALLQLEVPQFILTAITPEILSADDDMTTATDLVFSIPSDFASAGELRLISARKNSRLQRRVVCSCLHYYTGCCLMLIYLSLCFAPAMLTFQSLHWLMGYDVRIHNIVLLLLMQAVYLAFSFKGKCTIQPCMEADIQVIVFKF